MQLYKHEEYTYDNNILNKHEFFKDSQGSSIFTFRNEYNQIPDDTYEITEIKQFDGEGEQTYYYWHKYFEGRELERKSYRYFREGEFPVSGVSYNSHYFISYDLNNNIIEFKHTFLNLDYEETSIRTSIYI